MITADNPQILIASQITHDELMGLKRYKAGVLDSDKGVYKANLPQNNYPVLIIEENIINSDGTGLLKGFYEVRPDKDGEFLCLYQTGKLKAKIPVIRISRISDNPKTVEEITPEKKKKKYKNGKSPDDYIHSKAELYASREQNAYILKYELQNTRILGVMRLY